MSMTSEPGTSVSDSATMVSSRSESVRICTRMIALCRDAARADGLPGHLRGRDDQVDDEVAEEPQHGRRVHAGAAHDRGQRQQHGDGQGDARPR